MVGTATLTGRFSVAVVTASPESKVNICEVFIVLYSATDVVSAPAVIFDNELPLITAGQRKFPKTPVIRRIASPCAEPAARFPPVQARKGAGQIRNLFQFAMLFEKSKEKSKIRTWYHKSFLSTSRLSEGGRSGRERPGNTMLRACPTLSANTGKSLPVRQ